MTKNVTDWLREGEHLLDVGLAECRSIEERIAMLERQRAERMDELQAAARMLGRTLGGQHRSSGGAEKVQASPARPGVGR